MPQYIMVKMVDKPSKQGAGWNDNRVASDESQRSEILEHTHKHTHTHLIIYSKILKS